MRPFLLGAIVLGLGSVQCATSVRTTGSGPGTEPPESGPSAPRESTSVSASSPTSEESAAERDILVETDEGFISYDREGRRTARFHARFRILTESGIQRWSSMSASWSPWHQARPELRAEVKLEGGKTFTLDPKTIEEAAANQSDPDVYSDRRTLRAPLPGLAVGAVVDQELRFQDTKPFFEGGGVDRFYFGMTAPVEKSRLVIETPVDRPFRWKARGLAVEPKETVANGVKTLVFEAGPFAPRERPEPNAPPELTAWPNIAYSTSASWAEVARRYAELVDRQIAGAKLEALAGETKGAKSREEIIGALLAKLHESVRYTGVEFGEAAIVPRTPGETFSRGYGDCKDKAALLVAALRARGIESYIALLNAGTGEEIAEDLPGLEGFNHAIVHVPGKPALWIDATIPAVRLGYIPLAVQGHLALIARPSTTGLERIPQAASDANRYHEIREFHLAPSGPARIVELSEGAGSIEQRLRSDFARAPEKALRENLEKYIKSAYNAEELAKVERFAAEDVEKSFKLRLEIAKAKRGFTDDSEAAVGVVPAAIFTWIPELLRSVPDAKKPPRHTDFVFVEPYVGELEYRIYPPLGYTIRNLPDNGEEAIGPASFRRKYSAAPDGTVTASFRFDTGKRRYSPAEVGAFQAAFEKLQKEPPIMLHFDHAGARALGAGKYKEALAEYRRAVAKEPKLALHRSRLASALLQSGFGEAARAEAKRAVELDPGSLDAQFMLGWVLEHDLFGRDLKRGSDRPGAIQAYQKAKSLDPKNVNVRRNLAVLLEHDDEGMRYAPGARLEQAIAEYQTIRGELNDKSLDNNLMFALLEAGQYAELEKAAKDAVPSTTRNGMLLAASVLNRGPGVLLLELDKLGLDATGRQQALDTSWTLLLRVRRYAEAVAGATIAAEGAENRIAYQSRVQLLARVKRREEILEKAAGPTAAVQRAMSTVLLMRAEEIDFSKYFAKSLLAEQKKATARTKDSSMVGDLAHVQAQLASMAQTQGLSLSILLDILLSGSEFGVEGNDENGYRIAVRSELGGHQKMSWYVIKEEGAYRVRAIAGDEGALGSEALALLERGQKNAAKQWLDWARDEVEMPGGEDPLRGAPILGLWSSGEDASPEKIRIAAAALLAASPGTAEEGAAVLEKARASAAVSAEARPFVELALARAYEILEKDNELIGCGERLLAQYPKSRVAFLMLESRLDRVGRYKEAKKLCETRLEQIPNDADALHQLAWVYARDLGDFTRANQLLQQIIDSGKPTSSTYNNLAWNGLFLPGPRDRALEWALRAANLSKFTNTHEMHTLATLYAEDGKTAEAFQALRTLMDLRSGDPEDADWYIVGRIAEEYDLRDIALDAYKKVPHPKTVHKNDPWVLAEKRIAALSKR